MHCTWASACNFDISIIENCLRPGANGFTYAPLPWMVDCLPNSNKATLRCDSEKNIAAYILLSVGRRSLKHLEDDPSNINVYARKKFTTEVMMSAHYTYYAVEYMLAVKFCWRSNS